MRLLHLLLVNLSLHVLLLLFIQTHISTRQGRLEVCIERIILQASFSFEFAACKMKLKL